MQKTPRSDVVAGLSHGRDICHVDYYNALDLARELETEAHQTRIDAAEDSKRLIADKMKMFERITDLERDLAEAVAALRELVGWAPGATAWHTNAPMKAVEVARAILAKNK